MQAGRYGIPCQALAGYLVEGRLGLHLRCSALVRPCSLRGVGGMAGLLCCTSSPAVTGRMRGREAAPRRACARQADQEQGNSGQGYAALDGCAVFPCG